MRTLVTGGAGFIGSHLVDALTVRGDSVFVIDDLSGGRRSNLTEALKQGATLAEGNLADAGFVAEQLAEFAPELIFHLAAQVDVRKAVADPAFDAAVNVIGTINLLEAARRLPGAPVIFASTGGAIYGEGVGRELPFIEAAPALPLAAYGASKLAAESYLGLYRRLYGVPTLALRFANVYGPRQDPHGEAGVVAIFCGLLKDRRPLKIYGDGGQTRDYVFVADVVGAMLTAGDRLREQRDALAGPYNIGTGIETSVIELAAGLEAVSSLAPGTEHLPERPGEVRRVAIDPAAAAAELGWRPQVELADGLDRTYRSIAAPERS